MPRAKVPEHLKGTYWDPNRDLTSYGAIALKFRVMVGPLSLETHEVNMATDKLSRVFSRTPWLRQQLMHAEKGYQITHMTKMALVEAIITVTETPEQREMSIAETERVLKKAEEKNKEIASKRSKRREEISREITAEMTLKGRRKRHKYKIEDEDEEPIELYKPKPVSLKQVEKMGFGKLIEEEVIEGHKLPEKKLVKKAK